jgi:hypothetical protein
MRTSNQKHTPEKLALAEGHVNRKCGREGDRKRLCALKVSDSPVTFEVKYLDCKRTKVSLSTDAPRLEIQDGCGE